MSVASAVGADQLDASRFELGELPYHVLIESVNDGAATLDAEYHVLYANRRFTEILGTSTARFLGTSLLEHLPSRDRAAFARLLDVGKREATRVELNLDGAEGRQRLIRLTISPAETSRHNFICVVATEMTELLEANEALRSNQESLRQLSGRLLQLQDEERRRIARDLHDTSGQKLAVQSILLNQLESAVAGLDPQVRQLLGECRSLTAQLVEEVRTVSYLLHPPLLDELGLASALKWYTEGFARRTGIATEVTILPSLQRLPRDIEVALFRIVQESLTNVHRYAQSPKAYVRVNVTDDHVVLEIGDFGRGIEPDKSRSRVSPVAPIGVGIQGMKERMRQLSGKLEITSQPNQGTQVTATVPIAHLRPLSIASSAAAARKS